MASDNLSSRIESSETSPTTRGIRSEGQPIPRSGLQTDPLVAGKYIAYVDDGPNGQFIRRLDTSIWNYVVAQDSSGGIKPIMDKNLVWLNSLTKRLRYQSVALGRIRIIGKAPGDKSHPAVSGNYSSGWITAQEYMGCTSTAWLRRWRYPWLPLSPSTCTQR